MGRRKKRLSGLFLGESGAGKERAAPTLLSLSPRAGKPFMPVDCSGKTEILRADFRLVAATHCHLPDMVADGRFRQDLYFRIAAFPIEVSPFRSRKEDLPLLA